MAISLFDFLIKITGDSKGLEDAVNRSEQAVDNMASGLNQKLSVTQRAFNGLTGAAGSFTKGLFSMRGALGALLGTGGIAAFVKSSLSLVDSIGKTADRLTLSVEAAQEYQFAAGLAGVTTEEFEQAIIRLNTILSEGKSVYKTTDEALRGIANRIQSTSDASERAAIVYQYFGRSGAKLLPLFKDGAAGLDQLRKAARDAGVVFSEDFVRKTEEFNDQLEVMMKVIRKGLAEGIIEGFVDSSQDLKDIYSDPSFVAGVKDFGEAISSSLKFLIDNADTILRVMTALGGAKVGGAVGGIFGPIGAGVGALGGGVAGAFAPELVDAFKENPEEELLERIKKTTAEIEKYREKNYTARSQAIADQYLRHINDLEKQLKQYEDALEVLQRGNRFSIEKPKTNEVSTPTPTRSDEVLKELEVTDQEFADMVASIRKNASVAAAKAQEDLKKAQEATVKELETLEIQVLKSTGNIREAVELEANASIAVWEERYRKGVITEQQLAQARILILTQAAGEMQDIMEQTEETLTATDIARESWARKLSDDLSRAIFKMKGLDDAMKNFLLRLLEAEASNFFYSLLGFGNGSSGGSVFGNLFPKLLGFAGGGNPPVGRPSVVGEEGPEILVPNASSYVMPNGAGFGGMNIYVDARQANDPAAIRLQVYEGIMAAMPQITANSSNLTMKKMSRPRIN